MIFENYPIIGEGKQHQVYDLGDGNVLKVPKEGGSISLSQAEISVRFFRERFGEFVPPSKVYRGNDNAPYYIVQRKIPGKTLSDFLQEQAMSQEIRDLLSNFMTRVVNVFERNNVRIDLMGTSPIPEFQGTWQGCTNIAVHDSEDAIWFIDNVYFSNRMTQSDLMNRIKRIGRYGSYLTQRRRYAELLQGLKGIC